MCLHKIVLSIWNTNHGYNKAKQQHRIITKLHSVCYTHNYFPVVYPSILGWLSGVAQRHPRSIQHYSSAVGEPQLQGKTSDRCMHGYIHYPKEKPPCFRVISAVSSDACSDLIYAGHRPLYPLLMTTLAKSWSQDEWGFHSESRLLQRLPPPPPPPTHPHTHINPPIMWIFWQRRLWPELPRTRKEAGTRRLRSLAEHGIQGDRSWENNYYAVINMDEDDNRWRYGGPCGFKTTWLDHEPRLLSQKSPDVR